MARRLTVGLLVAVSAFAAIAVRQATAQNVVVVRTTISGEVLPIQLAGIGQDVKEGDALLFVRSSTGGAVPAARAPIDGRITQVLVRPGDHVNIGDVVAAIQPK